MNKLYKRQTTTDLDSVLRQDLVNALIPHLTTEAERQTILRLGLPNAAYRLINFHGPTDVFTTHMVSKLLEYGEDEHGKQTIISVLDTIYARVGSNKQHEIAQLRQQLQAHFQNSGWVVCPRCRIINGVANSSCYACGQTLAAPPGLETNLLSQVMGRSLRRPSVQLFTVVRGVGLIIAVVGIVWLFAGNSTATLSSLLIALVRTAVDNLTGTPVVTPTKTIEATPPPTFTRFPPTIEATPPPTFTSVSPTIEATPPPPPPTATPAPATVALEMILIPAGEFVMGSSAADSELTLQECNQTEGNCQVTWFDGETPARPMIAPEFSISKYEVTNSQYNICVANGVCPPIGRIAPETDIAYDPNFFADPLPAVAVSWDNANTFCRWAGARLPTEWEWEKAARGSDGSRRYPWGYTFEAGRANLASGFPTAVGSYPSGASPYGVLDMAGNASEWTATATGDGRYIVRGGAWSKFYFRGRVADRGTKLAPNFVNYDIGFRCVR